VQGRYKETLSSGEVRTYQGFSDKIQELEDEEESLINGLGLMGRKRKNALLR